MIDGKRKISSKIFDWLPLIALVIALVGGVPGILGIVDYCKRNSIKIVFDPSNSLACRIKSNNSIMNRKPAVLLYRIIITGKGLQPSYLREMNLEVKLDGKWVSGTQFAPLQSDVTDKMGVTKKAVHLQSEKSDDHDDIFVASWNNFCPGQRGLSYGEPVDYSYAAYFDLNDNEFERCKKLRIIVTDYLGHRYKEIVDLSPFKRNYLRLFLIQSPQ